MRKFNRVKRRPRYLRESYILTEEDVLIDEDIFESLRRRYIDREIQKIQLDEATKIVRYSIKGKRLSLKTLLFESPRSFCRMTENWKDVRRCAFIRRFSKPRHSLLSGIIIPYSEGRWVTVGARVYESEIDAAIATAPEEVDFWVKRLEQVLLREITQEDAVKYLTAAGRKEAGLPVVHLW